MKTPSKFLIGWYVLVIVALLFSIVYASVNPPQAPEPEPEPTFLDLFSQVSNRQFCVAGEDEPLLVFECKNLETGDVLIIEAYSPEAKEFVRELTGENPDEK